MRRVHLFLLCYYYITSILPQPCNTQQHHHHHQQQQQPKTIQQTQNMYMDYMNNMVTNKLTPSYTMDDMKQASKFVSRLWDRDSGDDTTTQPTIQTTPTTIQTPQITTRTPTQQYDSQLQAECGLGVVGYEMKSQSVCSGKYCYVQQVMCGDNVITPTADTQLKDINWINCTVTQLYCILDSSTNYWGVVSMYDQYKLSNCHANFRTTSTSYYVKSIAVPVMTCENSTTFGDYLWGVQYCRNDQLYCGGIRITRSMYSRYSQQIADGSCEIRSSDCRSSSDCYYLTMECSNRTVAGCVSYPIVAPCANPSSFYTNCMISKVECNGVIQPASSTTPLSTCSVNEVSCEGTPITFDGVNSCTAVSLVCAGVTISDPATYSGDISKCVVNKLNCKNDTSPCVSVQLTCPQAPTCVFSQKACNLTCTRMMNSTVCECPDDYIGTYCSSPRPIFCEIELASSDSIATSCLPGPSDDPKDYLLDGDRKCNVWKNDQTAKIGYSLDCEFMFPPQRNGTAIFQYWLQSDKLNLTLPANWTLKHKIFNLNRITDANEETLTPLTRDQIAGTSLVWFDIVFSQIPDRFWYGRRLYSEVSAIAPNNSVGQREARTFLDVIDRPIQQKGTKTLKAWQIALIVLAVLAVLAGGGVGVVYYIHQRNKKTKKLEKFKPVRS